MSLNTILYGPPGTGKTYNTVNNAINIIDNDFYQANKENRTTLLEKFENLKISYNENKTEIVSGRIGFVTFHPSFSYEQFVEGITAETSENKINYFVKDGIFKAMCKVAAKDENKNKPYILIIDEINRGNISAIFGELITLIETEKRLGNKEAISTNLPYSREEFSVPNNLYIIGTMNTADRSLTKVDIALRRRFQFEAMYPKSSIIDPQTIDVINLTALLDSINKRIEFLIDKEHTIGHSYFMGINSIGELAEVFHFKLIPLLEEYFFEDWDKICLVLDGYNNAGTFISKVSKSATDIFPKIDENSNSVQSQKYIYERKSLDDLKRLSTSTYQSIYLDPNP